MDPSTRRRFIARAATAAGTAWAAPVLSTAFVPAGAATASPPITLSSAVNITEITPPGVIGDVTSNTDILYWPEQCMTLTSGLTVDRDGTNGTFSGMGNPSYTIPSGTFVCSYYFRSERSGSSGTITGSIDFDNAVVVGVALENDGLNNSNILGSTGTNYGADGPFENNDSFTIGGGATGPSTLSFTMITNGTGGSDNIRIIVAPT